uniref:Uncharacterized protein n=1 Tax=Megaselia scalaris TaxID=36166 RepID=T1GY15_MEGSC
MKSLYTHLDKLIITLAILAIFGLALSVNSSVIAGHGLAYTAVSGPHYVHAPIHHASIAHHGYGYHDDGHWHGDHYGHDDGQWHGDYHHPAAIDLHHGHIPIAVHAPIVHHGIHHEGQYVAKTRGSVHTAPLAGHAQSAAAINVAPAPGTI